MFNQFIKNQMKRIQKKDESTNIEEFVDAVSKNFPKHWETLLSKNGVLKYAIRRIASKCSRIGTIEDIPKYLKNTPLAKAASWNENEKSFWIKMSHCAERIKNEEDIH